MLNILPTENEAIHSIAAHIVSLAKQNIAEKDSFTWVLSGGQTPKALYALLASPPFKKAVDWSKVFFFFGDERFVPSTDENSNYKMADTALLAPLQIPAGNIFPIDTSLAIDKAAMLYQQELESFFDGRAIVFDLILLGLGENLHVASLFPCDPLLKETYPAVSAVKTVDKNPYRITMNAPLINNAKHIYFLVSGRQKASALYQAFKHEKDINKFPVQLIRKHNTDWFVDEAAASYFI